MPFIKIDNTLIGTGQPPFIVAEAGINHNGDLETALKMIETAKKARVDAIKFQTFKANEFIGNPELTYTYHSQGKEITESMLEMFRRYEFSNNDWRTIRDKCSKEGIMFLSTPQNRTDLDLLIELGISAIKVGSDDFTNLPLLKHFSKTGLPMILSCGMSDLADIHNTLMGIGSYDGYPTILLLCTSQYPTPPGDVNLLKLRTLGNAFSMLPLGFSDHTQGELASSIAVALGACFFEKHFTLDHNLDGPDHWFSEDPEGLKNWVSSIRRAYTIMGSEIVKPTVIEKDMMVLARRSIVALCNIKKGERLTEENIGLKRPGSGLPYVMFEKVLGLSATGHIAKGDVLEIGSIK